MTAFTDESAASVMMATSVCRATQDRLQKYVARYFAEAMQDPVYEDDDEKMDALTSIHAQIQPLALAVPSLLTSVVPQLEAELVSDDVDIRTLAMQVLGALFRAPGNDKESFARLYPSAWKAWLGRAIDKHVPIRMQWTNDALALMSTHPALTSAMMPMLQGRAVDPDERVRGMLADGILKMDYETLRHSMPTSLLRELAQRGKDRRTSVRDAALAALGRAFAMSLTEPEAQAREHFAWIPGAILNCHLAGSLDVMYSVLQVWETYILPTQPLDSYVERLRQVYDHLSDAERAIFLYLSNLRLPRPTPMAMYVSMCRGDVVDDGAGCLQALAAHLHDTALLPILEAFQREPMDTVLGAMETCIALDATWDEQREARRTAHAYLTEHAPTWATPLTMCMWTGSLPWIGPACVRPLLDASATSLLACMAEYAPWLFAPHAQTLVDRVLAGDTTALPPLAALAVKQADEVPTTPALVDCLKDDALRSEAAAQALAGLAPGEAAALVAAWTPRSSSEDKEASASLQALAALLQYTPTTIPMNAERLADQLVPTILLATWPHDAVLDDVAWLEPSEDVPALACRLAAMRVLTQWCLRQADEAIAPPIFKWLWILLHTGEADASHHIPRGARARLRAYAAECLLDLAQCDVYVPHLVARMSRLAYALQDECYQVRKSVLHTLLVRVAQDRLPPSFHAVLFMVALDPEADLPASVQAYTRRVHTYPDDVVQERLHTPMLRFLHILSHHPDLALDRVESLALFTKYLDFYVAQVATASSISTLIHYAASLRQRWDATASTPSAMTSRSLHAMAELMVHLLHRTADTHRWTVSAMPTEPVPCPADILIPSGQLAQPVLPPDVLTQATASSKRGAREKKARRG